LTVESKLLYKSAFSLILGCSSHGHIVHGEDP